MVTSVSAPAFVMNSLLSSSADNDSWEGCKYSYPVNVRLELRTKDYLGWL